jgi:hypothetical protein
MQVLLIQFWEETASISLSNINQLAFAKEMQFIYRMSEKEWSQLKYNCWENKES